MTDPLAAYTLAERIRVCAHDRIAATAAGAPDRSCVIAGGIAWDNCECGQLTVAIREAFFSQNFPSPAATTADQFGTGRCGHPIIGFDLTVTMLRCVPTGDNETPPACADLAATAQVFAIDAAAVRDGVLCCLQNMLREKNEFGVPTITGFTVGGQRFVGPEGSCGGSALDLSIGILNRCPCG